MVNMLIVEDDLDLMAFYCAYFEPYNAEGKIDNLLLARSVESALKLLENYPVNILISDRNLTPDGYTGDDLVTALRLFDPYSTRILASSDFSFDHGFHKFGDGTIYFPKPIDPDLLIYIVEKEINRHINGK